MADDQVKTEQQAANPSDGSSDDDTSIPIDFSTFVLSLSSSAAYHLGLAPHPESHECDCKNLPMAKQTIDILAILEEKTKGNLTGEEERLLEGILYNLRLAYLRERDACTKK